MFAVTRSMEDRALRPQRRRSQPRPNLKPKLQRTLAETLKLLKERAKPDLDVTPLKSAEQDAESLGLRLTEKRLYILLLAFARHFLNGHDYPKTPDTVVYHLPMEALANVLGVNRVTIKRCALKLTKKHLIHYAAHRSATARGTRVDGTLWAVKHDPHKDIKPMLMKEDFDHPWRDLDADRKAGKVAFNLKMSQSNGVSNTECFEVILSGFIRYPQTNQKPELKTSVMTVTFSRAGGLCAVGDVAEACQADVTERIERAVRMIVLALADAGSEAYWRKRMWRLWRDGDRAGLRTLQLMCERAQADRNEGMARRAGALLVSRLEA